MRHPLPYGLLAAVLMAGAGCSTVEIDLYPLYRSGPVDATGGWEWEALGPLVYARTQAAAGGHAQGGAPRTVAEWGVRPLFSRSHDDRADRRTTEVLWPLGRFTREGDRWQDRFLPIYWYTGRRDGARERSTLFLLPFVFRRRGPPGDGWAFFPFYGQLRSFLGMEELTFVLFPLYARTRHGRARSHHVLWPLIGWGRGPEEWRLRVLPLYSRAVHERRYDRQVYLWPLLSVWHDLQDTARPRQGFHLWPFFGQWRREGAFGWSVLFPLLGAWEDRVRGTGERSLPYPFYQSWWSRRERGWRLWPLHGAYASTPTAAGSYLESRFYVWPLVWDRSFGDRGTQHRTFRVIPVFAYHRWTGETGGGTHWMVWPLLESTRRPDGGGKLAVFTPFPLRALNDAFHQRLGVFFSPYLRFVEGPRRFREQSWLGLYRRYRAPGFVRWSVPLLWSRRRSPAGGLDQFLCGTIRLETDASGASRLRLFGVPIPLSAASALPAARPTGGRPR